MNVQIKPLTWEDQSDAVVTFHVTRNQIGMSYVVTVENLMTFVHSGSREVARFPALAVDKAKAAAQADYEARILSALNSSPGKDGGQEVEAAEWQGRYWIEDENRWSNWITNPVGYTWAHEPQEGRSEIRYLYPQPASTALVEREAVADQIIGQVEDRFPNWRSYRDLIDCIDCTLHELRKDARS